MKPTAQFLIAAPHSGAGKTTVTLGLLRALRRKGQVVQPFKCGPDFIDPIHHGAAAGRDSINLDRFMMSDDHIRRLYAAYTRDAGVAVVEGVMGLFDGAVKSEGSAADLAKLLDLPVILVLNAKAMAYSAAAILYGLRQFDPGVRIAGALFNFVETESHYRILREAAADAGVPSLGYLPTDTRLYIPSRHLGLDTAVSEKAIEAAADHLEKQLDLDEWLRLTPGEGPVETLPSPTLAREPSARRTILIARDAAFHFLYPENIRRLEALGAVSYFSPLEDAGFAAKPDLIYLPGGYPELHLSRLSANRSLLDRLRGYASAGGKLLAECGGMMYLGRSIVDENGGSWPMAGILDLTTGMQEQRLQLGYRTLHLPGGLAKGHEFHYSRVLGELKGKGFKAYTARGEVVETAAFRTSGILASYMHFYWGEDAGFLESWLDS